MTYAVSGGLSSQLFSVRPDGRGERQLRCSLLDSSGQCHDLYPAYSSDGHRLALFTGAFARSVSERRLAISATDGAGASVYKVSEVDDTIADPAWSPGGQRIAYSLTLPDGHSGPFILTLTTTGEDIRVVSSDGRDPDWSSSNWIAFAGGHAAGPIYRVRPDGSGLRRLTRGVGDTPSWSPHASKIAFARHVEKRGRTGPYVYTMRSDGRGLRRLKTRGYATSPVWSPDGKWIAFIRPAATQAGNRLYKVRTDGTGLRRLTSRKGISALDWQPIPR